MSLGTELARLESLLSEPEYRDYLDTFHPPAAVADLELLQAEFGEWRIPEDVLELYSWHDGGGRDVVMGFDFLSIPNLLAERQVSLDFYDAPLWLPIFRNVFGARLFAEAEIAGFDRDVSLWTKGKDTGPSFAFSSLTSLFETVNEILDRRLVSIEHFSSGGAAMQPVDDDLDEIESIRQRRNPSPQIAYRSFFPDIRWPDRWLASLGVARDDVAATGVGVTTIAELISASKTEEVRRTIRARRKMVGSRAGIQMFTLVDDDVEIHVEISESLCAFAMPGQVVELDVVAGPAVHASGVFGLGGGAFARGESIRYVPDPPDIV
jgi:hypothetical protein